MTHNYAPNKAEPNPGQGLIKEQYFMELNSSVMKRVHAITRRYNLIALMESPDLCLLGNRVTTFIAGAVGVDRLETYWIVW